MVEQASSGVKLEAVIPLSWQILSPDRDPRLLVEEAVQVLQSMGPLEEVRAEIADDDASIHAELRRLDSKLDLLLRLFGQSLRAGQGLPHGVPVQLGRLGMSFQAGDSAPGVGQRVVLSMYLSQALPLPLELPGVVASHEQKDAQNWVVVTFDALSQALKDELNRFIFRHHRRAIAESRRDRSRGA